MKKYRNSPAETISGSCKIDIRFMLRNKYIVRNAETYGVLSWTRGQSVEFRCKMTREEKYLRLMYSITSKGSAIDYDYKIYIDEVPSNLGKGTILYFLCPESEKRSRILISAYGEHKFINRDFYKIKYGNRVYYGCQKTSKNYYHNTRYFDLKRKVKRLEEELNQKDRNSHYRGELTKDQLQLKKWIEEMEYHNTERAHQYAKMLNKLR
tara:strand:+ start:58 stop:684 length:627 start_codon:yes stop_codon:yes gene_type:complete